MADPAYTFSNGLRLHIADLMDVQMQRYAMEGNPNLHEPVEEEHLLRSFATDMPEQPVFLDVGAAVGYYSILVKRKWPGARVYAVDALPRHLKALRANLALNNLPADAVTILETAVGKSNGHAEFADKGYSSVLTDIMTEAQRSELPLIRVSVRSLPDLLEELPPVHVMKMDIQGSELGVLDAAREVLSNGRVKFVLVGTHGGKVHQAVRSLLEECGLSILHDDPTPPMQPDGILLARHS